MFSGDLINNAIDSIVLFSTDLLMPAMIVLFMIGVAMKALIHFTVKREHWFAKEFELRLLAYLDKPDARYQDSFFLTTKMLLEKTYYEIFVVREMMMRRKPDLIMAPGDRVFLIQNGCARLVRDTLKKIRFLDRERDQPDFLKISKNIFQNNACFSKVFGIIPINTFNDVLRIMPGVFVVGGIFGTFLGIMKALPDLGGMDVADVESTKMVMDDFLVRISYSMGTSIIGIIFSVSMTFVNALFSPDKIFLSTVNSFEQTLETLWKKSRNNEIPMSLRDFSESIDPAIVLAEDSVEKELERTPEIAIIGKLFARQTVAHRQGKPLANPPQTHEELEKIKKAS